VAGLFVIAAVAAAAQWLLGGQAQVFANMVQALFAMAKLSVEVMVLLFGTLTLWLGFLRIAEQAGVVQWLAKVLGPLFGKLMPEVPRGHPALGLITLNFAANGLGLDNAATPMGLKAMQELQTLNPRPDTATNAQILFLVLNASSLTLLPVTIFMYRMQQGAPTPRWCSCRFCWPPAAPRWPACWPWPWCSACRCSARWCWPICCRWPWAWPASWRC
jgi:spore maturation protein SpmA